MSLPPGFNFLAPQEEQFVPGLRAPSPISTIDPMMLLAQALQPWEQNIKYNTNPQGPYQGSHPQPNLEYEEMPAAPTPGVDSWDYSHSTRGQDGKTRFWRPKARPMS